MSGAFFGEVTSMSEKRTLFVVDVFRLAGPMTPVNPYSVAFPEVVSRVANPVRLLPNSNVVITACDFCLCNILLDFSPNPQGNEMNGKRTFTVIIIPQECLRK